MFPSKKSCLLAFYVSTKNWTPLSTSKTSHVKTFGTARTFERFILGRVVLKSKRFLTFLDVNVIHRRITSGLKYFCPENVGHQTTRRGNKCAIITTSSDYMAVFSPPSLDKFSDAILRSKLFLFLITSFLLETQMETLL